MSIRNVVVVYIILFVLMFTQSSVIKNLKFIFYSKKMFEELQDLVTETMAIVLIDKATTADSSPNSSNNNGDIVTI